MKLIYSIPNKLWYIHNFLDYTFYKDIHNSIIKERKFIELESSKNFWKKTLISNINSPDITKSIHDYPPFKKLKILIQHNPYFKIKKSTNYLNPMIYFWKKGTGINWHDDGNWKYGATYYINHKWNKNWGGEFMFNDENNYGFLPVVGNSLVVVKAPFSHKVNPVISPTMPRITIQIFMR